jgi:hypothetical protein
MSQRPALRTSKAKRAPLLWPVWALLADVLHPANEEDFYASD